MGIQDFKKKLRQKFRAKRMRLSEEERGSFDSALLRILLPWLKDKFFTKIFLFHPSGSEPNLLSLFDSLEGCCEFALPVVKEHRKMDFYIWNKNEQLYVNRFGIKEPAQDSSRLCYPDSRTIVLIPALACDSFGNRLGAGGGYYDRYLMSHPLGVKVGILYSFQFVKELPIEDSDIRLDHIFSENEQIL